MQVIDALRAQTQADQANVANARITAFVAMGDEENNSRAAFTWLCPVRHQGVWGDSEGDLQREDALLDRAGHDELHHPHRAGLPHPVHPVHRLRARGGVVAPPASRLQGPTARPTGPRGRMFYTRFTPDLDLAHGACITALIEGGRQS